jgi:hypothetical protein
LLDPTGPSRVSTIAGIPGASMRIIQDHEMSHPELWPGLIESSFVVWRRHVHAPRSTIDPPNPSGCPCCDPTDGRITLQRALQLLPPTAARDLRRVLGPLDDTYLRRATPTPDNATLRHVIAST